MSKSNPNTCPNCGKPTASNVGGLCPNCLMHVAMDTNTHVSQSDRNAGRHLFDAAADSRDSPIDLEVTISPDGAELFASTALEPGSRIGSFAVQRRLGEGGMGTVYEAHDANTSRRVALKVLKHTLNTPEARKRFLREGRTAASVNHPNSVYVYGTDNIDGKPIISMELVAGGTLQDLIRKNGALPVRQAVDAILQVIDGLEAAEKVGVLHRDIKPSNCFVDSHGTVKVGDFGLSVSTQGSEDSMVTLDKTVLGTPAFASPEQLRGEELDLRSDIYSVGVTLYYLLTGETPFRANNIVQLLATVLEKPAPSVNSVRSDVSPELAAVIQKCLAKSPSDRWRSYESLRSALQIHATKELEPPSFIRRTCAGVLDLIPLYLVGFIFSWLHNFDMSVMMEYRLYTNLLAMPISIAYFVAFESWIGTSPGKWLLGLRLIDADRKRPPFRIICGRATFFVVFPSWLMYGYNAFAPPEIFSTLWGQIPGWSYFILTIGMFSTVRLRNGMAAWHDLLFGVRVVSAAAETVRRPVPTIKVDQLPDTNDDDMIGPYHVLRRMGRSSGGRQTVLCYDMRLLRRVWVRQGSGDDTISLQLRDVARPGRLRWLNGAQQDEDSWDAYEATDGIPLLTLIRQTHATGNSATNALSWESVRGWIADLAEELAIAEQDGTLPHQTGLRYIWITADGRAKLLDFVCPDLSAEDQDSAEIIDFATRDQGSSLRLLHEMAVATLSWKDRRDVRHFRPLPLHAVEFLSQLTRPQSTQRIHARISEIAHRPATICSMRRWGMLAVAVVIPIFTLAMAFAAGPMLKMMHEQNPGFELVQDFAMYRAYEKAGMSGDDRRMFEIFIADKHADLVNGSVEWDPMLRAMVTPEQREETERIVAKHANATPAERQRAHKLFDRPSPFERGPLAGDSHWALMTGAINTVFLVALPCIACALLFRGGLLMLLFQVACVTRSGRRAGRGRMLWRAIWWSLPAFGWMFGASVLVFESERSAPDDVYIWVASICMACAFLLPLLSMLLPERGIPDRLSGTYLVPR